MSDCSRAIRTRWADHSFVSNFLYISLRNLVYNVYSLIVLFQVKKVFNDIFGEEEGPVQFEKVFNSQCNR